MELMPQPPTLHRSDSAEKDAIESRQTCLNKQLKDDVKNKHYHRPGLALIVREAVQSSEESLPRCAVFTMAHDGLAAGQASLTAHLCFAAPTSSNPLTYYLPYSSLSRL
jgi:hypothetical protein